MERLYRILAGGRRRNKKQVHAFLRKTNNLRFPVVICVDGVPDYGMLSKGG